MANELKIFIEKNLEKKGEILKKEKYTQIEEKESLDVSLEFPLKDE